MPHIEEARLHAYLDDQLPSRERSELEEHLATCAECRARIEEAERLVRESGALLERLDPGAPRPAPWSEIEARGAARGRRPRRAWLDPRLAWAASIALAFAVGWLTRGTQVPRELAQYEERAAFADSAAPLAQTPPASEETQSATRIAQRESPAGAAAGARSAERPPEIVKAQRVEPKEEPATPQPVTREDARAAKLELERRDRAFAAPAAVPEPGAAPAPAAAPAPRQRLDADTSRIALEQLVVTGESRRLADEGDELVGGEGFFRAPPALAETWLGARVRTLPGHTLQNVEVGPGAAVHGGLRGRPVVRLIYKDAAGREITLLQQRDGAEADGTAPALIVAPSGLRAYRWTDGGYVLTLTGPLGADSLRALAARVR